MSKARYNDVLTKFEQAQSALEAQRHENELLRDEVRILKQGAKQDQMQKASAALHKAATTVMRRATALTSSAKAQQKGGRREEVSAEARKSRHSEYVRKIVPKDAAAEALISRIVNAHVLFKSMDSKEREEVVNAMEKLEVRFCGCSGWWQVCISRVQRDCGV